MVETRLKQRINLRILKTQLKLLLLHLQVKIVEIMSNLNNERLKCPTTTININITKLQIVKEFYVQNFRYGRNRRTESFKKIILVGKQRKENRIITYIKTYNGVHSDKLKSSLQSNENITF